jgi:hypothetical protein
MDKILYKGVYFKFDEFGYGIVQSNKAKVDKEGNLKLETKNEQHQENLKKLGLGTFNGVILNREVIVDNLCIGKPAYYNEPDGDIEIYITKRKYCGVDIYKSHYARWIEKDLKLPIDNSVKKHLCIECNEVLVKPTYKYCYGCFKIKFR